MNRQDAEGAEAIDDKAKSVGQGVFPAFAVLCFASVLKQMVKWSYFKRNPTR
jgi:hypothetical protein